MILEAKKIQKSYRSPTPFTILSEIDLQLMPQKAYAIMGRSGAGKSTLLHILGTLERFDSGKLIIQGEEVTAANAASIRNNQIGFVFQSYQLLDDFTVIENVLFPARIGRRELPFKRAIDLLEKVGLKERIHFPVKLLSGGEKQRVSIARALCNDPPLILADEPSGNLDEVNSSAVFQLLLDLVRHEKKTLLMVTHDESFAKKCDHIFVLQNGKLNLSQ